MAQHDVVRAGSNAVTFSTVLSSACMLSELQNWLLCNNLCICGMCLWRSKAFHNEQHAALHGMARADSSTVQCARRALLYSSVKALLLHDLQLQLQLPNH
jgi:hypothetical protein